MTDHHDGVAQHRTLERLDELEGQVAAGVVCRAIAHEVRNALNPMNMQLELLRRKTDGHEGVQRLIDALRKSVGRIDAIMEITQTLGKHAAPHSDTAAETHVGELMAAFRPDGG